MCINLDIGSMVFEWVNISNMKVKTYEHWFICLPVPRVWTAAFFLFRVLEWQHNIEYALNLIKQSWNYSQLIQMGHINTPLTHGILIALNITHETLKMMNARILNCPRTACLSHNNRVLVQLFLQQCIDNGYFMQNMASISQMTRLHMFWL